MRKVFCLLLIFFHINTYSNVNIKTELSFEEYELYTELNRSLVTISKGFINNSLKEGEDSVALIGLKEYLGLINNVNFKHQYKLNTIINNTEDFVEIYEFFKGNCNQEKDKRSLCSSSLSYLANQDISVEKSAYKKNEVSNAWHTDARIETGRWINKGLAFLSGRTDVAIANNYKINLEKQNMDTISKIRDASYLEVLKQTARTLIDIESRIAGKNINLDKIINKLCTYEKLNSSGRTDVTVEKINVCRKTDNLEKIKKYLVSYYNDVNSEGFKKYTYQEVKDIFNSKLDDLNIILSKVSVASDCNLENYKEQDYTKTSGVNANYGGFGTMNRSAQRRRIGLGSGYKSKDDNRVYKDKLGESDEEIYNSYKEKYFNMASSPLGSIVFSSAMQGVDSVNGKEYYDQGLRLLSKDRSFLGSIGALGTNFSRLFGDWQNIGRDTKLACSRYHANVSLEQVKSAVGESIKNLYSYANYVTESVYDSSSMTDLSYYKATRRMLTYSPMLIADILKHNPDLKEEILWTIHDIAKVDRDEKIAIGVIRGVGMLSLLAMPIGAGFSFAGSALANALTRGIGAVAGIIGAAGELKYAGILRKEKENQHTRISRVYEAYKDLKLEQGVYSSKGTHSEGYLALQEEEELNKMMLALEIFGVLGDAPDVINYFRSFSRLNKFVKTTLKMDNYVGLTDAITKTNKQRRVSANFRTALSYVAKNEDRVKIIENLLARDEANLVKFLEENGTHWSSSKFSKEFDKILKPKELSPVNKKYLANPERKHVSQVSGIRKELFNKFKDSIENNQAKNKAIEDFENAIGEKLSDQEFYEFFNIHMIGADPKTGNLVSEKPGFIIMKNKKEAFNQFCRENSITARIGQNRVDEFMKIFSGQNVRIFGFLDVDYMLIKNDDFIFKIKELFGSHKDNSNFIVNFKNGAIPLDHAEGFAVLDIELLNNLLSNNIKYTTKATDLSKTRKHSSILKISKETGKEIIFTEFKDGKSFGKLTISYDESKGVHHLEFDDLKAKKLEIDNTKVNFEDTILQNPLEINIIPHKGKQLNISEVEGIPFPCSNVKVYDLGSGTMARVSRYESSSGQLVDIKTFKPKHNTLFELEKDIEGLNKLDDIINSSASFDNVGVVKYRKIKRNEFRDFFTTTKLTDDELSRTVVTTPSVKGILYRDLLNNQKLTEAQINKLNENIINFFGALIKTGKFRACSGEFITTRANSAREFFASLEYYGTINLSYENILIDENLKIWIIDPR